MICVVDRYIPFIKGKLEAYFDQVYYLEPDQISHDILIHTDALLIRTRTKCNAELLAGTAVRFIGTATIGTDHIDIAYCRQNGITVVNAPGCNARGVAQYIESAIKHIYAEGLNGLAIGIIGLGHVGSLVKDMAERENMHTLLYDPPRQRNEGGKQWESNLTEIAKKADIITFHTPLTKQGTDKTWHLADSAFLDSCKPNALIINAARGGIVDEQSLLKHNNPFVIDTWENEPNINDDVLKRATIATPHIAGYSKEGKINATRMILGQMARYFNIDLDLSDLSVIDQPMPVYDILADDKMLRQSPQTFEQLRQNYALR